MVATRRLALTGPSQSASPRRSNPLECNSFAELADDDDVMQDASTSPPHSPTDPAAHTSLVEFVPREEPRALQLTSLPEHTVTTLDDLPDLPSLDVATVASLPDFTGGLDLTLQESHAFNTEETQRQLAHIADTTDARLTTFAQFISSSLHTANTVFTDLREKVTTACTRFHTDLERMSEQHNAAIATFNQGFTQVSDLTTSLGAATISNRSGVQAAHARIHELHRATSELWSATTSHHTRLDHLEDYVQQFYSVADQRIQEMDTYFTTCHQETEIHVSAHHEQLQMMEKGLADSSTQIALAQELARRAQSTAEKAASDCETLSALVQTLSTGNAATDTAANPAVAQSAAILRHTQEFESRLRDMETRLTQKVATATSDLTTFQQQVTQQMDGLSQKVHQAIGALHKKDFEDLAKRASNRALYSSVQYAQRRLKDVENIDMSAQKSTTTFYKRFTALEKKVADLCALPRTTDSYTTSIPPGSTTPDLAPTFGQTASRVSPGRGLSQIPVSTPGSGSQGTSQESPASSFSLGPPTQPVSESTTPQLGTTSLTAQMGRLTQSVAKVFTKAKDKGPAHTPAHTVLQHSSRTTTLSDPSSTPSLALIQAPGSDLAEPSPVDTTRSLPTDTSTRRLTRAQKSA